MNVYNSRSIKLLTMIAYPLRPNGLFNFNQTNLIVHLRRLKSSQDDDKHYPVKKNIRIKEED